MLKKYNIKKIGEIFESNEGYKLEVIDGGSKMNYCVVRVDNKYNIELNFNNIKHGKVKNLYHPSVYDKGYFGEGTYSKETNKKIYKTWQSMLQRCYDPKFHEKRPTYKDIEVSKEWFNFQVFAEWFVQNYVDGYDLDKDLLSEDKKKYDPVNCLFIPHGLNQFLSNKHSTNTSGFIGVSQIKQKDKYSVEITDMNNKTNHLGHFDDIEEASQVYQTQREIYANIWKERMKDILPQKAINNIK